MVAALITGAIPGIGREIAWQLATERTNLILAARNVDRLREMAGHIRQAADAEVEVLPANLLQVEGTLRVCECLVDDERPVGLLVNNTGFGLGQDFVDGDIEHELNALNVMVRVVLVACHTAIPDVVARGGGSILDIASMAVLTVQGICSTHKAWIRTFVEGLATSLKGTDINVAVVYPDLVYTKLREKVDVDPGQ